MFALSIEFLKDEAIKILALDTGDEQFKADDIQWVLTVPAIWTPAAKQFMREAANQVRLHKNTSWSLIPAYQCMARIFFSVRLNHPFLLPCLFVQKKRAAI